MTTMPSYTPSGPDGQTVDVPTLVRGVLATQRGGDRDHRMQEIAANTLFWLEEMGVKLTLNGEPFSTYEHSFQSLERLLFEELRLTDPVDAHGKPISEPDEPACADCGDPRYPRHVADAPGPTVRHMFRTRQSAV